MSSQVIKITREVLESFDTFRWFALRSYILMKEAITIRRAVLEEKITVQDGIMKSRRIFEDIWWLCKNVNTGNKPFDDIIKTVMTEYDGKVLIINAVKHPGKRVFLQNMVGRVNAICKIAFPYCKIEMHNNHIPMSLQSYVQNASRGCATKFYDDTRKVITVKEETKSLVPPVAQQFEDYMVDSWDQLW